jgi:hypothetical protein
LVTAAAHARPLRHGPSADRGGSVSSVADASRRSGPPRPGAGSAGRTRQGRSRPRRSDPFAPKPDQLGRRPGPTDEPAAQRVLPLTISDAGDRCRPPVLAREWHEPPPSMSVASAGEAGDQRHVADAGAPGHRGRRASAGGAPASGLPAPPGRGWWGRGSPPPAGPSGAGSDPEASAAGNLPRCQRVRGWGSYRPISDEGSLRALKFSLLKFRLLVLCDLTVFRLIRMCPPTG